MMTDLTHAYLNYTIQASEDGGGVFVDLLVTEGEESELVVRTRLSGEFALALAAALMAAADEAEGEGSEG
jgi:hypothetical protein